MKNANKQISSVIQNDGGITSVFGGIYIESVRSSKVKRQALFKSLLDLFDSSSSKKDSNNDNNSNNDDDNDDNNNNNNSNSNNNNSNNNTPVSLLKFMAQTLVHLPFQIANEPLNIISKLGNSVALEISELNDAFSSLFGIEKGEEGDDEEDVEISELRSLVETKADIVSSEQIETLVERSEGVVVMLKLKYFLKGAFSLSDAKIQEYDEKEVGRNVVLTRPHVMPLFRIDEEENEVGGGSSSLVD